MKRIYLDNAAGSWPKPPQVAKAMSEALESYGANPGRGGYALARETADMVEDTRSKLARLINAPDPRRIVFTAGATMSLNMALRGYLRHGDHVVYSGMEHNAVYRPLCYLVSAGRISFSRAPADCYGYIDPESVARLLQPHTSLIVLSHASNVCGSVQPLKEVSALAAQRGIPLLVDAAQSAGLLPLDAMLPGLGMLALPAHKALYGPTGLGALYVREGLRLEPLISGGTGGQSERKTQPPHYPEHLEAGSLNTVGIAGWNAALDFVDDIGVERLYQHGMELLDIFIARLQGQKGIRLYLPPDNRERLPVLSFNIEGCNAFDAAMELDKQGFCLRSGYHCAPLAHRALRSYGDGTLRLSPGWFNTAPDIEALVAAVEDLSKH